MEEMEEKEGQARLFLDREKQTGVLSLISQSLAKTQELKEDENFIYPVFRALSKIIIPGYFLNFTLNGVLKRSTPLVKNQTVYPDHQASVERWLGTVEEARWDESSEPAGINVRLRIDKMENPKIVKGLQVGAIHSVSLGVNFLWRKSHDRDDFYRLMGEKIDGEVVSFLVTNILNYSEISLVHQGADPYAKRRAELVKPLELNLQSNQYEYSPRKEEGGKKMIKITRKKAEELSLEIPEFLDESMEELEMDQSKFNGILAQHKLNLTKKDKEREKISSRLESLTNSFSDLTGEDVTSLTGSEIELKAAQLKDQILLGEKYITSLREDTEKNYRLAKGDGVDETILTLIKNSDIKTLQALQLEYKKEAEGLHPKNSRQSSKSFVEEEAKDEDIGAYEEQ